MARPGEFPFTVTRKVVASCSGDNTVRIWSVETGECEHILKGHSKGVSSAVFSHGSKVVASATDDSTVRIWSVETGECEHVVDIGLTQALYFTADDTGLVTDARVISLTDESITSAKPPIRPSSPSDLDLGINGNNSWVLFSDKELFWLPAKCRRGKLAISGNSVVIGCKSGRVVILSFSSSELRWLANAADLALKLKMCSHRSQCTSRRARYLAAVRQQGMESEAEILMVRIMEATLVVARTALSRMRPKRG
ncbi:hypothetical protein AUP68_13910 [Ilyonectria robusta]